MFEPLCEATRKPLAPLLLKTVFEMFELKMLLLAASSANPLCPEFVAVIPEIVRSTFPVSTNPKNALRPLLTIRLLAIVSVNVDRPETS